MRIQSPPHQSIHENPSRETQSLAQGRVSGRRHVVGGGCQRRRGRERNRGRRGKGRGRGQVAADGEMTLGLDRIRLSSTAHARETRRRRAHLERHASLERRSNACVLLVGEKFALAPEEDRRCVKHASSPSLFVFFSLAPFLGKVSFHQRQRTVVERPRLGPSDRPRGRIAKRPEAARFNSGRSKKADFAHIKHAPHPKLAIDSRNMTIRFMWLRNKEAETS